MRKWLSSCFFILLFLSFLFYNDTVITEACNGLLIWYRCVLPSLLPFMILVNIMLQTDTISLISKVTSPLIRIFPGVSEEGSFAVTAGFLCGYPMGAKVSGDLVRTGRISSEEGAYLLSFCNNTSPMFILGIFFAQFIPDTSLHLPFFLILIISPLLCGQIFRIYYTHQGWRSFPAGQTFCHKSSDHQTIPLSQIIDGGLMDSFEAIVKVGMYIMLFSILTGLADILLPGSSLWELLLLASMEITAGLSLLSNLAIPVFCKYVLLMALTSFGGFCAIFQTMSMIHGSGLKLYPYIIEKLITAMVTSLLTILYLQLCLYLQL